MNYYRLADNQCGGYMHTGYNDTSKKSLRDSLISYMEADYPDATDEDWKSITRSKLDELAEIADVTIETSKTKFKEVTR